METPNSRALIRSRTNLNGPQTQRNSHFWVNAWDLKQFDSAARRRCHGHAARIGPIVDFNKLEHRSRSIHAVLLFSLQPGNNLEGI